MAKRTAPHEYEDRGTSSEDTLALSFLDVLSCGLGAGIYLFLVFSVMPHVGETGSGPNAPISVVGDDSAARTLGAKFEEWEDVVSNATILVVVQLQYSGEGEPPGVDSNTISFRRVPRHSRIDTKNIDGGMEWFLVINDGLRPPQSRNHLYHLG